MVICAGSGGVGKTTTAAAVALGLAERGLKVAVVTIDPARRLANALGLDALTNEPTRVECDVDGELWAMMLDAKRTFDQLIEHLAPDERTRDEVLREPHLPAALDRGRGLAGVHGDRQALRARRVGRAGTCWCSTRRRRATRSTSSTPRAAHALLPGPRDPDVPQAGRAARARDRARVRRAAADHRRRSAARPVGVLPRAERDDRRLHRARAPRRRAAGGPGDDVPDRHRARATTRSRRRSSSTASCARRGCRSAGWSSTASISRRRTSCPTTSRTALGPKLAERVERRYGSAGGSGRPRRRERRAAALRARRPADARRPRARGRRPRPRGSRPRALTPVRLARRRPCAGPGRGARRARRAGPRAGSRRAPRRASSTSCDGPHEAAHRGALERDRLADAVLEPRPVGGLGADRGEPLGDALVAVVGEQRAGGEQPVRQRLDGAGALAAELEAPQRPGELAGARRAAGDEAAERAQRVLLLGWRAGSPRSGGAGRWRAGSSSRRCRRCGRRRSGRARARRRPTGAARSAGAAAGGRRTPARGRPWTPARAPRRSACGSSGSAGGRVGERDRAHERRPVAERHLVGLDHQALDGRDDDAERAAGVGRVLELAGRRPRSAARRRRSR